MSLRGGSSQCDRQDRQGEGCDPMPHRLCGNTFHVDLTQEPSALVRGL